MGDLDAVVSAAGVGRFALLGVSGRGPVAVAYAAVLLAACMPGSRGAGVTLVPPAAAVEVHFSRNGLQFAQSAKPQELPCGLDNRFGIVVEPRKHVASVGDLAFGDGDQTVEATVDDAADALPTGIGAS